ncbi:MAG: hypothetical protein J5846_11075, partial [Desulfovibrio sp.]|nr:hypothetical protein [Desulfovibrio sp.]
LFFSSVLTFFSGYSNSKAATMKAFACFSRKSDTFSAPVSRFALATDCCGFAWMLLLSTA